MDFNLGDVHLWLVNAKDHRPDISDHSEFRGLLRSKTWLPLVLSKYPEFSGYRIKYLASGQPVLKKSSSSIIQGDENLYCSASHSMNLGVYALSLGRRIGVDIEKVRCRKNVDAIYNEYYHPVEAESLSRLGPRERVNMFTRYWTLKESQSKVFGEGVFFKAIRKMNFYSPENCARKLWLRYSHADELMFWSDMIEKGSWLSVAVTDRIDGDKSKSNSKSIPEVFIYNYFS